ncbi:transposase IS200-family protein, partial [mine drainage metagenome]
MNDTLETGKTRWTHDQIAYHFVVIPQYRRKILVGAVDAVCKALIAACCNQHGLRLLALETDSDQVHCLVSAPPRWAPATLAGLLKGYTSHKLRERFPNLQSLRPGITL